MNVAAHQFSAQYLKQVYEEWLYVQAIQGQQQKLEAVNGSGLVGYSYRALPGHEPLARAHAG